MKEKLEEILALINELLAAGHDSSHLTIARQCIERELGRINQELTSEEDYVRQ